MSSKYKRSGRALNNPFSSYESFILASGYAGLLCLIGCAGTAIWGAITGLSLVPFALVPAVSVSAYVLRLAFRAITGSIGQPSAARWERSATECGFCEIISEDCPDRVDSEQVSEGRTTDLNLQIDALLEQIKELQRTWALPAPRRSWWKQFLPGH